MASTWSSLGVYPVNPNWTWPWESQRPATTRLWRAFLFARQLPARQRLCGSSGTETERSGSSLLWGYLLLMTRKLHPHPHPRHTHTRKHAYGQPYHTAYASCVCCLSVFRYRASVASDSMCPVSHGLLTFRRCLFVSTILFSFLFFSVLFGFSSWLGIEADKPAGPINELWSLHTRVQALHSHWLGWAGLEGIMRRNYRQGREVPPPPTHTPLISLKINCFVNYLWLV